MKRISSILWFIALVYTTYSCNGKSVEDETSIIEDYLPADYLVPSEDVERTIKEKVSYFVFQNPLCHKDSLTVHISCYANFDVTNCKSPSCVKLINIDTSCFWLIINEGVNTEITMNWMNHSDNPLLKSIKSILDTGTFSLHCTDEDISPQDLLNSYFFDTITTSIEINLCITCQ